MSFDKSIVVVAALGFVLTASAASAQMKGENDSGVNRSQQQDQLNNGRSTSNGSMPNNGTSAGGMKKGGMSTDTTGRGTSTGGNPGGSPGRS